VINSIFTFHLFLLEWVSDQLFLTERFRGSQHYGMGKLGDRCNPWQRYEEADCSLAEPTELTKGGRLWADFPSRKSVQGSLLAVLWELARSGREATRIHFISLAFLPKTRFNLLPLDISTQILYL
jgi:hypothetical protein